MIKFLGLVIMTEKEFIDRQDDKFDKGYNAGLEDYPKLYLSR